MFCDIYTLLILKNPYLDKIIYQKLNRDMEMIILFCVDDFKNNFTNEINTGGNKSLTLKLIFIPVMFVLLVVIYVLTLQMETKNR